MAGLLKKDILLIVKNFTPAYFIAILPPILVSLSNPSYFILIISVTVCFLFAVQVSSTLELDEKVHWQKIAMAMPISTMSVAISKYILTLIMAVFAGGIVTLASALYMKQLTFIYGILVMVLVILYNSAVIPVSYRFGTSKSRYFILIFVSIPILLAYLFGIFDIRIEAFIVKLNIKTLCFLLGCIGTAIVFLSIYATVRTLNRRELLA